MHGIRNHTIANMRMMLKPASRAVANVCSRYVWPSVPHGTVRSSNRAGSTADCSRYKSVARGGMFPTSSLNNKLFQDSHSQNYEYRSSKGKTRFTMVPCDIPNQTKPIVVCLCVRGVRTACIMCCMHTCSSLCMQFHSHPQTHHLERPQKLEHCPATQRLHSSQKRRYHYCSSVSLRICQMLQLCQLNTAADLIRQVQCNNKCNQVQGATKVAPLSSRCHEFQPLHMNRLH